MILARGAEAILVKEDNILNKIRIEKKYRHPFLDHMLRKRRTKLEARLLSLARRVGVPTPKIFKIDVYEIQMEYIEGQKLSKILHKLTKVQLTKICKQIGNLISTLHNHDIIHGDLTTANMILGKQLYFIDFGLGEISKSIEKKAVDLHLLYQIFKSNHTSCLDAFDHVIQAYLQQGDPQVIQRMKQIQKRGRYK